VFVNFLSVLRIQLRVGQSWHLKSEYFSLI
jgi:hypothetical protein